MAIELGTITELDDTGGTIELEEATTEDITEDTGADDTGAEDTGTEDTGAEETAAEELFGLLADTHAAKVTDNTPATDNAFVNESNCLCIDASALIMSNYS